MLPNLFLIGVPKAGTTSLADALAQHPSIFVPRLKEPHYFGSDKVTQVRDFSEYQSLFREAHNSQFRVDASTHTLSSHDALIEIAKLVPDAKFIAVLRDPVDAIPSYHSQLLRQFDEPEADFELAWKNQPLREAGKLFGPVYTSVYDYGRQLRNLYSLFPEKNIIIFSFDELNGRPQALLSRIYSFLNIEQEDIPMERLNANRVIRSHSLHKLKYSLMNAARTIKWSLGIQKNFGLFQPLRNLTTVEAERRLISRYVLDEISTMFEQDYATVECLTGIDIRKSVTAEHKE